MLAFCVDNVNDEYMKPSKESLGVKENILKTTHLKIHLKTTYALDSV